jgi:hypothetical protein
MMISFIVNNDFDGIKLLPPMCGYKWENADIKKYQAKTNNLLRYDEYEIDYYQI